MNPATSKEILKASCQNGTPKGILPSMITGLVKGIIDIQNAISPSGSFSTKPRAMIEMIKGMVIGNMNCCESASLSTAEPTTANSEAYRK